MSRNRHKHKAKVADEAPEGLIEATDEPQADTLPAASHEPIENPGRVFAQNAGPMCERCGIPMKAGSTSESYTYYYCRNRNTGCPCGRKVARGALRAYLARIGRGA